MALIEVEVDSPLNRNLVFLPTGTVVRGRLDFMRADASQRGKLDDYPRGIAGQRIGFDTDTNVGYVAEPLHDPEHADVRKKIEAAGFALPEKRKEFTGPGERGYDWSATWLHWIKRAVESGLARVTKGKVPAKIEGRPRPNFVAVDPAGAKSAADRTHALLYAMLTPEQQARFNAAMANQ